MSIYTNSIVSVLDKSYLKEFLEQENDNTFFRGAGYKFLAEEIIGEIIDINFQYLRKCPSNLLTYICCEVSKEVLQKCKEMPSDCGWCENNKVYNPIKFTQQVIISIKQVCKGLLDNSNNKLGTIIPTVPPQIVSVCSIKNKRRTMEDRHSICTDFNLLFNLQDLEPTSFYAIFDGHAGKDAANYAAAHLHHNIATNPKYPNIEIALQEAFLKTDLNFIEKSRLENLHSGTTAVCALLRYSEKKLWVGWVGDSQAVLVKNGKLCQIVRPHTCENQTERQRISKAGGNVLSWNGQYRVNGQLLISRAIGDVNFKPYVSAEPEIECIPLDGNEDFLILACDGLWDFVNPDDCAISIYKFLESSEDTEHVAKLLIDLAIDHNSADNITVIVIFLKPPNLIKKDWFSICYKAKMDSAFEEKSTLVNEIGNQESKTVEELENEINLSTGVVTSNKLSIVCDEGQKFGETEFLKPEEDTHDKDNDLFNIPIISENNCEKSETTLDVHSLPNIDGMENKILEELSIQNSNTECDFKNDFNENSDSGELNNLEKEENESEQLNDKLDSTEKCDIIFEKEIAENDNTAALQQDQVEKTCCDQNEIAGEIGTLVDSGAEDSEEEWNYIEGKTTNNHLEQSSNVEISSNLMDNVQENFDEHSNCIGENLMSIVDELKVDCSAELDDNMASQLNPDAKEFVPLSPQRSTPTNPFAPSLHLIDDVIAQSPRKGTLMDDIPIPSENEWSEFENEISKRPHELESNVDDLVTIGELDKRPDSATSNNENGVCAYQELNLKEAMQGDEKLEGEYNDETDKLLEEDKELLQVNSELLEKSFKDEDPMNKSFYEGRGTDLMLTVDKNDELNKVQVLPNNEEVDEKRCNESDTNKENICLSELSETQTNINNCQYADTDTVEENDGLIEPRNTKTDTVEENTGLIEPQNIKADTVEEIGGLIEPQRTNTDTFEGNTGLIQPQNTNLSSTAIYSAAQELTDNFSNLLIDVNGIQTTNTLLEQKESCAVEDLPVESEQNIVLESPKQIVNDDSIKNQIILSETPKELNLEQHIPSEVEMKDILALEIDVPPKIEEEPLKAHPESVKKPMKVTSSNTTAKPKSEPKKSDIKIGTVSATKVVKKTTSATSNKPIAKSSTAAKPIASRVMTTRPLSANNTKTTTATAISGDPKKTTPVKIAPITRKPSSSVQANNSAVLKPATALTKSNSLKTGATELKTTVTKTTQKLSSTVPTVPKVARISPIKPRTTPAVLKSTTTVVTDVKPKVTTAARSNPVSNKIKDTKTIGTGTDSKILPAAPTKSTSTIGKKPALATRVSKTTVDSKTAVESGKKVKITKKTNESKEITKPNGTNVENLTTDLDNETTTCASNGDNHVDNLIVLDPVNASV